MHESIIVVDFETYYSDEYSLRKMNPIEYILHPEFEVTGAAIFQIKVARGEATRVREWVEAPDLPARLKALGKERPWSKRIMMSHNIGFDGAILAWRYGVVPGLYVDTLGMARTVVYPVTGSASLDSVASFYGLGKKDTGALVNAKGMRLADLRAAPHVYERYRQYAMMDAQMCYDIYERMRPSFPHDEYNVMDMVARMAILPQVTLDKPVLEESLAKILHDKENLLDAVYHGLPRVVRESISGDCGANMEARRKGMKDALMSNDKLAMILEWRGVLPPTKISRATGKQTWAFSKTDKEFIALQEHDDPLVQAVVAARLGVKSTIEETRTRRFIAICDAAWPAEGMRAITKRSALAGVIPRPMPMPMPLRYGGARTHRLSGDWLLNVQNMGRGSMLRKAIKAPPGYKIVSADESQVEARLNAAFASQGNLIHAFINGEDVYSSFASQVFGFKVDKNQHPKERFLGKTAILGLGYGMGAVRYAATCWVQGRVEVPVQDAERVVGVYRRLYSGIASVWNLFSALLKEATEPHSRPVSRRMRCDVTIEVVKNLTASPATVDIIIRLPNGMVIPYYDVRAQEGQWPDGRPRRDYTCKDGRGRRHINGTLMTENVIQALARIVVMDAAVRLRNDGFPWLPLLQAHDELFYCVPESVAPGAAVLITKAMSVTPKWLGIEGLMKAEAHIGDNMLEVK